MRITLEPNVLSGEDVLTIEGLSKSFGDNNLFSGIDMDIKRGEHVALIGGNGTGKTTILKMINRLVSKDAGAIILGSRVKIGYYDQEHQVLTMSNTIFDEISDAYPDLSNTRIRNVLAAFLFTGEDVFKRIQDLSGGERGRVSLAKLMLSSANFLILDEPTNHLDITSKEILENAIRNYTGTVLYVSHDRYFINQTATRIIELRDKQLTSYIGNYDYYETHRTYSTDLVSPFTPISGVSDAPAQTALAVSQAKLSWQESKAEAARQRKKANDLKKLEASIEELENRIAEIDEQFLLPENATNVGPRRTDGGIAHVKPAGLTISTNTKNTIYDYSKEDPYKVSTHRIHIWCFLCYHAQSPVHLLFIHVSCTVPCTFMSISLHSNVSHELSSWHTVPTDHMQNCLYRPDRCCPFHPE